MNTYAPRLIPVLEIAGSNTRITANKRVFFHDAKQQIETEGRDQDRSF